jgi:hypothetical protein
LGHANAMPSLTTAHSMTTTQYNMQCTRSCTPPHVLHMADRKPSRSLPHTNQPPNSKQARVLRERSTNSPWRLLGLRSRKWCPPRFRSQCCCCRCWWAWPSLAAPPPPRRLGRAGPTGRWSPAPGTRRGTPKPAPAPPALSSRRTYQYTCTGIQGAAAPAAAAAATKDTNNEKLNIIENQQTSGEQQSSTKKHSRTDAGKPLWATRVSAALTDCCLVSTSALSSSGHIRRPAATLSSTTILHDTTVTSAARPIGSNPSRGGAAKRLPNWLPEARTRTAGGEDAKRKLDARVQVRVAQAAAHRDADIGAVRQVCGVACPNSWAVT